MQMLMITTKFYTVKKMDETRRSSVALPWLAAGSAFGALMGGPPGAVMGFFVGAIAKGVNDVICPRCRHWMTQRDEGIAIVYTCKNDLCRYQRIELKRR